MLKIFYFSFIYQEKKNPISCCRTNKASSEASRTFKTSENPNLYLTRLLSNHINLTAGVKNGQGATNIRYCNDTTPES